MHHTDTRPSFTPKRRRLHSLLRQRRGATIVEYMTLVGLMGAVVLFVVLVMGGNVSDTFEETNAQVSAQTNGPAPTPGVDAGTGPNGESLGRTNTPGGAAPVARVAYPEYVDLFYQDSYTSLAFGSGNTCFIDAATADPNATVWCTDQGEAARPSNLEWRVNSANAGAPIWHGQTCLYDTADNDFVRNINFSIELAGFTTIRGDSSYDGTWLFCTSVNTPQAVLIGNGAVVGTPDGATTYWTAGGSTAGLPTVITMEPAPTWATFSGGMPWLGAGTTTYPPGVSCPYSSELERWLTLSYRQNASGDLFGWIPCQ